MRNITSDIWTTPAATPRVHASRASHNSAVFIKYSIILTRRWSQWPSKQRPLAQCVLAKRLTCVSAAGTRTGGKMSLAFASVFRDAGLGYSAARIAEWRVRMGAATCSGSSVRRRKGRTVHCEQSRVTNGGDISAERWTR